MDAAAYKAEGTQHFQAKNYDAAITSYTSAIELDGSNHVLYSNRSACYASLNKFPEAKADAEKCVEINPQWAKGYVRLGAALHGLKDFDGAIGAYNNGLKIEPENASLKEGLASVEREHAAASNPFAKVFGPDTMAKIASNSKLAPFLAQPDYVQIINTLVANPQMIQMYMKDQRVMQTFLELSGIQIPTEGGNEPPRRQKSPEKKPAPAKPKKDEPVLTDQQKEALAHKEQGNKLYKERKFDEALACYAKAVEVEPTNPTFFLNQSAVLIEQGNFDDAFAKAEEGLKVLKEHKAADYQTLAKLMTKQGVARQKQKNFDEAITLFKSALVEHRNAETLSKLEAVEKEKKLAAEQAYLSDELSLKAKEEGNTFFKADNYPEAAKCYSEAIKRNPKDHTCYSNRAAAYLKLGAYDDALKDAEKCVEINPEFVRGHVRKGHALYWTKQYHRAMQSYETASKLDKDNAEAKEGYQRTMYKIREQASSGEVDEDAQRRAMADPEIQAITNDSYMQMVLREISMDPTRLEDYMRDPGISAKINKLIAAGILRFGGPGDAQGGRGRGRGGR